ncbi:MAG: glycosyltransferase [Candidatus Eremiobacteraeota bacterium]|nr:glycosyltransferase [Candidatus Eremiobacteraeota bacterium]
MKVFLWHVHGSWTTAFVQGRHEYYFPVLADRGPDGRGRAQTWDWPPSAKEITPQQAAAADVDVVILQRPQELYGLAEQWLGGRRPGCDVAAVYLEHNAPEGRICEMKHHAADRPDLTIVHVTHFNDLFWDAGSTPTRVIEHGIIDPGYRYTGQLARCAVVINEPLRRGRVTGTDLLARLASEAPLDLFGMGASQLGGIENLIQADLLDEVPKRRAYVHPIRWTSLGLSLIEAMHLGMPVVALGTTEVPEAVPPQAGVVSTNLQTLSAAIRRLLADPDEAKHMGRAARAAALARYGLERFLRDWDHVLMEASA